LASFETSSKAVMRLICERREERLAKAFRAASEVVGRTSSDVGNSRLRFLRSSKPSVSSSMMSMACEILVIGSLSLASRMPMLLERVMSRNVMACGRREDAPFEAVALAGAIENVCSSSTRSSARISFGRSLQIVACTSSEASFFQKKGCSRGVVQRVQVALDCIRFEDTP
jgi:hypothetical protein